MFNSRERIIQADITLSGIKIEEETFIIIFGKAVLL